MISQISQLDLTKKYTYADYLTWQFAERVELIKGWILQMSPATSRRHQLIAGDIFSRINLFLGKEKCNV